MPPGRHPHFMMASACSVSEISTGWGSGHLDPCNHRTRLSARIFGRLLKSTVVSAWAPSSETVCKLRWEPRIYICKLLRWRYFTVVKCVLVDRSLKSMRVSAASDVIRQQHGGFGS